MRFPCNFVIYRLRCVRTNRSYIGFTVMGMARRWQVHLASMRRALKTGKPMTYLWRAINRYGEGCWEKTELYSGMAESMRDISCKERAFIQREGTMAPNGYNLTEGGEGCVGCVRSVETREKLRRRHLGMKASEETKRKMSEAQAGRIFETEHRAKLSKSQMGEKNHRFGKRLSRKERGRLSLLRSGEKNGFYGRKHSVESIEAMRRNARRRFGVNNHAARAVMIGNKEFKTVSDAARFVGVSLSVMCGRMKSPKWSDYRYLEVA